MHEGMCRLQPKLICAKSFAQELKHQVSWNGGSMYHGHTLFMHWSFIILSMPLIYDLLPMVLDCDIVICWPYPLTFQFIVIRLPFTLRSWVYDLYLKKVHLLFTSYHLQNVMHCRRFRLERQLASSQVPKEQQINLMKDLERKETEYMRLKRHKICVDDFELLTIIGRGAFGEVRKLNFVIYFSTCTYVLFMAVNLVSCTNFLCPKMLKL